MGVRFKIIVEEIFPNIVDVLSRMMNEDSNQNILYFSTLFKKPDISIFVPPNYFQSEGEIKKYSKYVPSIEFTDENFDIFQ